MRSPKPRAIIVSVDFGDLLEVTLPYNCHHFDEIMVITSSKDIKTLKVVRQYGFSYYITDAFYENGAVFNKWKALEGGLDFFGRRGWLCLLDADILWPKEIPDIDYKFGYLYGPCRRIMEAVTHIPEEKDWVKYPKDMSGQFAGYSQVFHAEDVQLGAPPWHQINWRHAGGADTYFQDKWPKNRKIRLPFEVLHLGPIFQNWCGRVSNYLDGTEPENKSKKLEKLNRFLRSRKYGPDRHKEEKF